MEARWARENGVGVGPGRGSAAGSLVAYSLRIVDLDPLAHNLLFERFLNPGRKSMPDIDTDFAVAGRDRVVQYVTEKYGSSAVARIGTFGKLLHDDTMYVHLVTIVSRADSLMNTMAGGKGTIQKLFTDQQLYDQLVKTVTELNSVLVDLRRDPRRYTQGMVQVKLF